MNYRPLVSVMMFCRNATRYIRGAVESVLAQDYRNIEFVIQDGASTDGTLEILKEYAAADPRIKLVSEPDSGAPDAFLRAFRRCQGDVIGCCLSDEEMLPGAITAAVEVFLREPNLGVVTGDADMIGADGEFLADFVGAPFDLVGYLAGLYCPYWSSTFFSKRILDWLGVIATPSSPACLEFEIWCRMAMEAEIRYLPKKLSKYRIHSGQLSHADDRVVQELDVRLNYVRLHLFGPGAPFAGWDYARDVFTLMQLLNLHRHLKSQHRHATVALVAKKIRDMKLLAEFEPIARGGARDVPPPQLVSAASDAPLPAPPRGGLATAEGRLHAARTLFRRYAPEWARKGVSIAVKRAIARLIVRPPPANPIAAGASSGAASLPLPSDPMEAAQVFYARERLPLIYDQFADFFHARGQIDQALLMWKGAEPLKSEPIDAKAVQAALKQPSATDASLLALQQRWANVHAASIAKSGISFTAPYYDGKRKIRIGFLCGWWNAATIEYQALPWLRELDRTRYSVHAYSPTNVGREVEEMFDGFHVVGELSSQQLVQKFRADALDVLCEFTGYSPYHRFVAMAGRGATVQVSYLNHAGTSGTPNIHYVLADATSLTPASEPSYSEKAYRVPGCFFNFNYAGAKLPRIEPPPFERNGYITFGCFGSESKVNDRQIAIWADLLRAAPDARLFLRNNGLSSPVNLEFMRRRFALHGIAPERLRLEKGADRMTILENYGEVDISLDTWPYNGGNTIAESVWQGVPVVTLKGDRFAAAYGASILEACGLGDLVAETPEAFVEVCLRLAADKARLRALRNSLRDDVFKYGFSDSTAFARKLEFAFEDMLRERLGMERHAPADLVRAG